MLEEALLVVTVAQAEPTWLVTEAQVAQPAQAVTAAQVSAASVLTAVLAEMEAQAATVAL